MNSHNIDPLKHNEYIHLIERMKKEKEKEKIEFTKEEISQTLLDLAKEKYD